MRAPLLSTLLLAVVTTTAQAQLSALRAPYEPTRGPGSLERADGAVRTAAENLLELTRKTREAKAQIGRYSLEQPLLVPKVVRLTSGGKELAPAVTRGGAADLTLSFESTGEGAFPTEYKDFLQSVYAAAKPTIDVVFGQPAVGGAVRVANFDATIGDRQAVAGGYFLPNNGQGQPEIRFAVYTSPEAAAVNFIHTLLLAYMGPHQYKFDAYQEGLARAATMRIVRTPGALPAGLDPALIEQVLDNSYDVGPFYDWYNQVGLESTRFIAPNLLDAPLPSGGSVGGLYLLRYRMAGSAWQKVLVQYPTFIAKLNAKVYANPSIASSTTALTQAGQEVLDSLGGTGSKVENLSLAAWLLRQYVLHVDLTRGQKLVVEPTPITSGLAGSDFGVFLIEAHYIQTLSGGNEVLLSGTSYPIFWEGSGFLNRVFPSAQEDRMDLAGGYGSVVPNLPNLNAGQPYRAIADVPVGDQLGRVYLPAGAIATPSKPTENTLYGTVIGASGTMTLEAYIGSTKIAETPVVNGAFGVRPNSTTFLRGASVVVRVVQSGVPLLTRRVNKGPGGLALDLRVNGEAVFSGTVPAGISTLGFPVQPFSTSVPAILRTPTSALLAARFDPTRATYQRYPDMETFKIGHGYFVRLPAPVPGFQVLGQTHPGVGMSVALRPGWNLIAAPKLETVPTNRVRVVRAADFPMDWNEAIGSVIGTDFFRFVRGPADAASGVPERGTMEAATEFRPGEAYYVRVLAPEGVTLLFEPNAAVQATRTRSSAAFVPDGWLIQAQVIGKGEAASAHFGQSSTATSGWDLREDGGLPPRMGGLQAAFVGEDEPMYRDVRRLGTKQSHRLVVEGLTPGQGYTLRFTQSRGKLGYFQVKDLTSGVMRKLSAPASFSFTASGAAHSFDLFVPGGSY